MQLQELKQEIEKYSYKPGWGFEVIPSWDYNYSDRYGRVRNAYLRVKSYVEDSTIKSDAADRPRRNFYFSQLVDVSRITHADIRPLVERTVQLFEAHEFAEWLRYNGELVDDPHSQARMATLQALTTRAYPPVDQEKEKVTVPQSSS